MKKLLVLCLVVGVAALAAIPADADCRRVNAVQYQAAVVHQPVVVATTFLAVPVPVYPVYGVGYGQGADIQGLRDEIKQLRRQISDTHPQPPGPPVVGPPMPPATSSLGPAKFQDPALLAMVTKTCATCHDGSGARDSGLKLAFLTDDKRAVADQPEGVRWKAYGLVSSGDMPKGGKPVSDAELQLLFHYAAGK